MKFLGLVIIVYLISSAIESYGLLHTRTSARFSTHWNRQIQTHLSEHKSPEILACELWIQRVVVGYNLCPWAEGILQHNKLKFTEFTIENIDTSTKVDQDDIYDFLVECHDFVIEEAQSLKTPYTNYTSTIVVLPNIKFQLYLDLVDKIQSTFDEILLSDDIQIATFHPFYKYENTKNSQVENYTNRSPYAMIHLLRVSDVAAAIEQYKGQTHTIYEKNIQTMNSVGLDNMKTMLKQIINDSTIRSS